MIEAERRLLDLILPRLGVAVSADPASPATRGPVGEFLAASRREMNYFRVPPDSSLPEFCNSKGIRRIHLLDLGLVGGDLRLMRSAVDMIRAGRIDIVRFDYCRPGKRGESIGDVQAFLVPFGFTFYRFGETGAALIDQMEIHSEDWTPNAYIALAPRLKRLAVADSKDPGDKSLIDVSAYFAKQRITAKGVIHVGGHYGEELPLYKRMGFRPILFIEANPDLAEALRRSTAGDPDVIVANYAASDTDGEATLRITSNDLSSSILPLKMHRAYYPGIDETRQVTVPARRLDTLLSELQLSASRFNFLHLDIQGAELMALRGAPQTLTHIEALITEVNFEELYEGCGLFDELDDYLTGQGLRSQTVTCPFHPSWGDALYVRPKPHVPPRDSAPVSISTLGLNGRYGNQLFQYAFASIVARHHNLDIWTPPWVGQQLFGIRNVQINKRFTRVHEAREFPEGIFPHSLFEDEARPAHCDLWGFMQFDTVHYAPYKDFIRSLYKPRPEIESPLRTAFHRVTEGGRRPLVALHIRRGDFNGKQFFAAPSGWYRGILDRLWPKLKDPLLYICSDELPKVLPDFADFNPITEKELGVRCRHAEFYTDFWVMTQADVLAISNSSYSFFASLLNERSSHFFRPHLYEQRLIPYDPWNTPPILHRELGEPLSQVLNRLEKKFKASLAAAGTNNAADIHVVGKSPSGSTFITFQPRSDNAPRKP